MSTTSYVAVMYIRNLLSRVTSMSPDSYVAVMYIWNLLSEVRLEKLQNQKNMFLAGCLSDSEFAALYFFDFALVFLIERKSVNGIYTLLLQLPHSCVLKLSK